MPEAGVRVARIVAPQVRPDHVFGSTIGARRYWDKPLPEEERVDDIRVVVVAIFHEHYFARCCRDRRLRKSRWPHAGLVLSSGLLIAERDILADPDEIAIVVVSHRPNIFAIRIGISRAVFWVALCIDRDFGRVETRRRDV